MSTQHRPIEDEFQCDDARLCESIKALIEISDEGTATHPVPGMARQLLAAAYHRLKAKADLLLALIAVRDNLHGGPDLTNGDADVNHFESLMEAAIRKAQPAQ